MDDHKRNRTEDAHQRCVDDSIKAHIQQGKGESLRFQIGDLVKVRQETGTGIVVKVNKANSLSLSSSRHSVQHVQNSPDVYYVYFSNESLVDGPYYTSELSLWS